MNIWRMEGKSWILINTLKGLHYSLEKKKITLTHFRGRGRGGGVAYNGKIIPGVSKLLLSRQSILKDLRSLAVTHSKNRSVLGENLCFRIGMRFSNPQLFLFSF